MLVLSSPLMILYNLPLPSSVSTQNTLTSTTPHSCLSRSELSDFRCGRRVTSPSRQTDYVQ
ncbi:unnamed protein product [Hymenolepis diminuta]|uniref:Uncharacterized protein n=1 Tax=Hymenolepis diminuta TaxID=6216 RepID=A0A564Z9S1_HYMDI|nr:unnamed protein product [Hymenolepis diminuta]